MKEAIRAIVALRSARENALQNTRVLDQQWAADRAALLANTQTHSAGAAIAEACSVLKNAIVSTGPGQLALLTEATTAFGKSGINHPDALGLMKEAMMRRMAIQSASMSSPAKQPLPGFGGSGQSGGGGAGGGSEKLYPPVLSLQSQNSYPSNQPSSGMMMGGAGGAGGAGSGIGGAPMMRRSESLKESGNGGCGTVEWVTGDYVDFLDVFPNPTAPNEEVHAWRKGEVSGIEGMRVMLHCVDEFTGGRPRDMWINCELYPDRIVPFGTSNDLEEKKAHDIRRTQEQFKTDMVDLGYSFYKCQGDGNCLFRAIAHQVHGDEEKHEDVRRKCCDYMLGNEQAFSPMWGSIDALKAYVKTRRNAVSGSSGEWGDDIEMRACEGANK
jgi:hypothetical protein